MTEQERKKVVERIDEDKKSVDLLKEKKEKVVKLEQNNYVKEYLETLKDIESLESKLKYFKNEKDMINFEFIWAFQSRIKGKDFSQCLHNIWIYMGSYGLWMDPRGEHDHYNLISDETEKNFEYNQYVCLECGKTIQEKNWQEFEKNNLVLKSRDIINIIKEDYVIKYYQLLYNCSIEEAQKIIINSFYQKKAETQILKLQKKK